MEKHQWATPKSYQHQIRDGNTNTDTKTMFTTEMVPTPKPQSLHTTTKTTTV
jgi:hypothetical protein